MVAAPVGCGRVCKMLGSLVSLGLRVCSLLSCLQTDKTLTQMETGCTQNNQAGDCLSSVQLSCSRVGLASCPRSSSSGLTQRSLPTQGSLNPYPWPDSYTSPQQHLRPTQALLGWEPVPGPCCPVAHGLRPLGGPAP